MMVGTMTASPQATPATGRVDLNALRTNQVLIVAIVIVAYVLGTNLGSGLIVSALAISMSLGALRPGTGPLQLLYKHVILRTGLVHPNPRAEDPAPHRFAQVVGGAFLMASAVLLLVGASVAGWILAWIVVALALTNLVFGFCAGCFVFFQLRKAGLVP
jgi:Domain of unknown function (DUF4395)